jgi:hypothetical protein
MSDLVRDMNLSKNQFEFLALGLRGWIFLEMGTKISLFWKCQEDLVPIFFLCTKFVCTFQLHPVYEVEHF